MSDITTLHRERLSLLAKMAAEREHFSARLNDRFNDDVDGRFNGHFNHNNGNTDSTDYTTSSEKLSGRPMQRYYSNRNQQLASLAVAVAGWLLRHKLLAVAGIGALFMIGPRKVLRSTIRGTGAAAQTVMRYRAAGPLLARLADNLVSRTQRR